MKAIRTRYFPGKLGGWKNYLTEDELVKMEAWTDKFLANEPELKAKLFAK